MTTANPSSIPHPEGKVSAATTWETRTVFKAIAPFQVIAASEAEALQIAEAEVRSRPFTESVQVILSKAWRAENKASIVDEVEEQGRFDAAQRGSQ